MNQWQILNSSDVLKSHVFKRRISLDSGYNFDFSLDESNYYYDETSRSGVFVFGYVASRIDASAGFDNYKDLYLILQDNPGRIAEIIKGIFTIVLITEGKFTVFNDPFGISKIFFTRNLNCFGGRIQYPKEYAGSRISPDNLLEYYVFNYNLNGNTFFRDINYSTPATRIQIRPDGKASIETYFDVVEHLSKPRMKIPKKEVFTSAAEIWKSILMQWQQQLNGAKARLSLTAGLDSRIILGGFQSTYPNFSTFTFGDPRSGDVIYAKLLAKEFGIPHQHCFPGQDFFNDFLSHAQETYSSGDTLVTVYRAHRLDAYKEIMGDAGGIFLGMGGSDLVRGFGYDRLIVSDIAWNCWNNRNIKNFLSDSQTMPKLKSIGFSSVEPLLDREDTYQYIYHPLHYLFKVIIPLHFSQDVTLSMNNGWKIILPFIDLDYLDFLASTEYFEMNDFVNFKSFEYKRRYKGLYYSARLSNELNSKLSDFTLGKGYCPKDIIHNRLGFLLKGLYYKLNNKHKPHYANFTFGEWFWGFLDKYLKENNLDETGLNTGYLKSELATLPRKGGELLYLDYTKAVNIHLATQI